MRLHQVCYVIPSAFLFIPFPLSFSPFRSPEIQRCLDTDLPTNLRYMTGYWYVVSTPKPPSTCKTPSRQSSADCMILPVIHRLDDIAQNDDKVAILDREEIVEYEVPGQLRSQRGSRLAGL